MKKCLIFILVMLAFVNNSYSQTKVNIKIDDRSVAAVAPALLHKKIDVTLSNLFNEFRRAYNNNSTPQISHLGLQDRVVRQIESYWDMAPFVYSDRNLSTLEVISKCGYAGVRVAVNFKPNNQYGCIEDNIVIEFNKKGGIENFQINGRIPKLLPLIYNAIDEKEKFKYDTILKFVEKFRLTYQNMDIETLKNFFREDAIIVVGNVKKVKQSYEKPHLELLPKIFNSKIEVIRLTEYTKSEYINNMNRLFIKSIWISVKFDYTKMDIDKIYGNDNLYFIQVPQEWNGSNGYHDIGYLTMMWDFSDMKNPSVWTRIWMPEKIDNLKSDNVTIFID